MGRRKKARKPPPKRKAIEPLDVVFNCPFCNHEKSCEVKMDRNRNTGIISCRVCLEDFQTSINCKLFFILSNPQNLKLKLKKVLLCTNISKWIYYFY